MNARKLVLVVSIMYALQPVLILAVDNSLDDLIDSESTKMSEVQDDQSVSDHHLSVDQSAERLTEVTIHTPLAYLKIASDERFIQLLLVMVVVAALWHYNK